MNQQKSELFQELYGISLSGANTESRLNKIIEKHDINNTTNRQLLDCERKAV